MGHEVLYHFKAQSLYQSGCENTWLIIKKATFRIKTADAFEMALLFCIPDKFAKLIFHIYEK